MNRKERIASIKLLLKENNGASIKELSDKFSVSEMTIRRDLAYLKENNIVKVLHGAAIYNSGVSVMDLKDDYDFFEETTKRASEKYRVGQLAASLIKPDDSIIFDIGTTIPQLIRHIPDDSKITAICCTRNALLELQKKQSIELILSGGYYRKNTQMFESPEGIELVNRTRATKAFISAAGINKELGITCVNSYEIKFKRAAINSALEKILVIDSSKFDKIKSGYFADISEINSVVTDTGISNSWKEYLQDLGIKLYIA